MNIFIKSIYLLLFSTIIVFSNTIQAQELQSIEINSKQSSNLMIPTAFTPNGDGINDNFKIANLKDEKIIDFRVFNRWGTIYYLDRGDNKGWDGSYKDRIVEPGAYGYIIRIQYKDGREEVFKGTVLLFR
ncbi:MAG TPA: gliding motility-associated C-terminal domain-containing protein [Edaphocola sp.]|nr:gliding motility-associated C-terminal domain-containing protein [Edaphocola sp.]